jgi:hypothetical protein
VKRLSVPRLLLMTAVLGTVSGVGLSAWKNAREERELEKARDPIGRTGNAPRPNVYELAGKKTFANPEAVKFLPEYPKAVPTDLAETTLQEGVPMKAAMFSTTDSLDSVLEWYQAELDKQHQVTVSQRWGDGAAYVGFQGPDAKMHTVSLMRSGSHTFVFLANSDPEAFLRSKAQRPAGMPEVPGLSNEVSFDFSDEGLLRTSYMARTASLTLSEAVDFYRKELADQGWKIEQTDDKTKGAVRLEAKRERKNLSLTLLNDERDRHVAIYANILARR